MNNARVDCDGLVGAVVTINDPGTCGVRSRRIAPHIVTAGEGSEAPRFELPDAQGLIVRLDDLLQRGPVVLVFLRAFA